MLSHHRASWCLQEELTGAVDHAAELQQQLGAVQSELYDQTQLLTNRAGLVRYYVSGYLVYTRSVQ